jgi:hypothetical protein
LTIIEEGFEGQRKRESTISRGNHDKEEDSHPNSILHKTYQIEDHIALPGSGQSTCTEDRSRPCSRIQLSAQITIREYNGDKSSSPS